MNNNLGHDKNTKAYFLKFEISQGNEQSSADSV